MTIGMSYGFTANKLEIFLADFGLQYFLRRFGYIAHTKARKHE